MLENVFKGVKEDALDYGIELSEKEARILVLSTLSNLTVQTKESGQIIVRHHGTYRLAKRAARNGRNPQTGEDMVIPASVSMAFKPAKATKDYFNDVTDEYNLLATPEPTAKAKPAAKKKAAAAPAKKVEAAATKAAKPAVKAKRPAAGTRPRARR